MWRIENPTIRTKTFDFGSSGQANREVSQLVSGDVVLMNALDLMEWNEDGTQVLICDHCGTVGCSSGDWINLRKAGDLILMVPVFDEIESDAWKATEYGPPSYLRKNGTPYFIAAYYQSVLDRDLGFPEFVKVPDLKMSEAVRLVQAEMPYRMFGEPPIVELIREKRGLVVGASDGDHQQYLDTIADLLRSHYDDPTPAQIRDIDPNDEAIYLFLDAEEFVDWKVLAKIEDGYRLILDDSWIIEPISANPKASAT